MDKSLGTSFLSNRLSQKFFYGFSRFVFLGFLLSITTFNTCWAASEAPQDIYTLPKIVALQNRTYYLNHDLSVGAGYLPLDAFVKSITLGASYTYYLSDFVGWEVINANYSYNLDTGLKNDLRNQFAVRVTDLPEYPTWYALTSIVYTPLYTKNLLFNKSVVPGETSFVFGGGVGNFTQNGLKPMVGGGLILRYFTSPTSSLKFDIRTLMHLGLKSDVILSLAVAYSFELGGSKKNEDAR